MRWTTNTAVHHDARTKSPRLSAARPRLAVGRRGLGPKGQEERRTLRTSFVATHHRRLQTAAAAAAAAAVGQSAGFGCSVEKNPA